MNPLFWLIAPAMAQDGVDAHHFSPVPTYGGVLDHVETWRIEEQATPSFGVRGLIDASSGNMVQVYEDWTGATETSVLDDVITFNLGVRSAVGRRLALTVAAPLYLASNGVDGAQGAGIGDVRLAAPIGLLLPTGPGVAVGLVPLLDLPTGNSAEMLGGAGVGAGGLVAAGWHGGRLTADLNLGYQYQPTIDVENLTGGSRLLASLGVGVALTEGLGLGGEILYDRGLAESEVVETDSPAEALLSLRGRVAGLGWTLGGGTGLNEGVGAPAWRAFAGVTWSYQDDPERDIDGDGVLGQADSCPREPEVANGWKDADGCPDALADLNLQLVDDEGTALAGASVTIDGQPHTAGPDGRLRLEGRMPDAPLVVAASAEGRVEGRLEAASLEEGPNPRTLTLPWLPGTVRVTAKDASGQPIDAAVTFRGPSAVAPGSLGEAGRMQTVLPGGEWQVLVTAEGYGTEGRVVQIDPERPGLTRLEFSLTPPRAEVQRREVVISEAVLFDFNEATLRSDSTPLLRQVAGQLLAHPEVLQVEIQGHTDNVGDDAYNLALSQQRVEAVRAWLVANGVAADRLIARGYGEARPIATNGTEAGRATNRRVQFQILKEAEPKPE